MQIRATEVDIRTGDLLRFPADAIVVPLDSGGLWQGGYHQTLTFSGVNGALQRETGFWFHTRAAEQVLARQGRPILEDGQAILVDGSPSECQHRSFRKVIFVLDNLFYSLEEIVASGLKAAYEAKLESVSLPLIRSGVMTIVAHFAIEDLIVEMARGIRQAIDAYPEQPMQITVLVSPQADSRWLRQLPQVLDQTGQALRQEDADVC